MDKAVHEPWPDLRATLTKKQEQARRIDYVDEVAEQEKQRESTKIILCIARRPKI